jgi:hypothetical protein
MAEPNKDCREAIPRSVSKLAGLLFSFEGRCCDPSLEVNVVSALTSVRPIFQVLLTRSATSSDCCSAENSEGHEMTTLRLWSGKSDNGQTSLSLLNRLERSLPLSSASGYLSASSFSSMQ